MRRARVFSILFCICLCFSVAVSFAAVPGTLSYQGTLTNNSGVLINGTVTSITFRIYDQPTGGNLIWGPETHNSVPVTNGLFSCVLNNISASVFSDSDRYISIQVDNDLEMSPRQKINSVPYATKSEDGIPSGVIVMWSGTLDPNKPNNGIPSGWALCDGTNGTPNLTDRFIVGAGYNYNVDDKSLSVNYTVNLNHSHTVNSHNHGGNTVAASAGTDLQGSHNHNGTIGNAGSHYHELPFGFGNGYFRGWEDAGGNPIFGFRVQDGTMRFMESISFSGGSTVVAYSSQNGDHNHGVSIDSQGSHSHTGIPHSHGINAESIGTSNQLSSTQDIRPPYYALAFIMKR
ncbi:MAG: hypothetical protein HY808_14270 [Nitrospirae bacterium]|nr:hypothetical protein [Nitrospirota bacterium]